MQRPVILNEGIKSRFPSWPPTGVNKEHVRAPEYTAMVEGAIHPSKLPKATAVSALLYTGFETGRIPDPYPDYRALPSTIWTELETYAHEDSVLTGMSTWYRTYLAAHMDNYKSQVKVQDKLFIAPLVTTNAKLVMDKKEGLFKNMPDMTHVADLIPAGQKDNGLAPSTIDEILWRAFFNHLSRPLKGSIPHYELMLNLGCAAAGCGNSVEISNWTVIVECKAWGVMDLRKGNEMPCKHRCKLCATCILDVHSRPTCVENMSE